MSHLDFYNEFDEIVIGDYSCILLITSVISFIILAKKVRNCESQSRGEALNTWFSIVDLLNIDLHWNIML